MFFLLLLLATASCTLSAMEIKYFSVPKELPEDLPEISKKARKATIETINLKNLQRRKEAELESKNNEIERLKRENKQLLLDRHTTITQNNSNQNQ